MTTAEILQLPAGPELDRVIAEELWGWERGQVHITGFSHNENIGWMEFYDWLEEHRIAFQIRPPDPDAFVDQWFGYVGLEGDGDCCSLAPTPLLAAWRAALAWHFARKEQAHAT